MSKARSLAGIVLALGGFEIEERLRHAPSLPSDGLWPHVWKWLPALSLLGFVHFVENDSRSSIGWCSLPPKRFVTQTAASLVVLLGANVITSPVLRWINNDEASPADSETGGIEAGMGSFTVFSIPERLFIAFTAGVTEELLFHGYATERLLSLTDSRLLAGAIPTAVLTWGHLGDTWDRSAICWIAQPAVLTSALYLRVRNLPVLIAAHALNDAVGLVLAERYTEDASE